ncbi:alpha/beta hydrolase [Staphylococcus hominis]|uniref:RBBP9/YdeN family alpha/beta hydrolase n=1 Tax=Staphylococcus hominis TaxID=1290 RepID=UPI0012DC87D1|nr:alpha/beta hydrolase [Staphylococcus hominis]MDS0980045.1 alpha/beta hydrolase [Staphylococcus hominis]QGR80244.1 serine hydrolase family protein [Staphylococcus hominis]UXR85419.1 alpha/beta hydrolase [Staphylococcus hominis]
MTDVIIVHSQIGNAHNHWYQWLKHNLALEGYNVQLFNLDKEDNKKLDMWLKAMKQQIKINHPDTYVVTHGYGSIAALKFIEQLDLKHPIEGFFSIAGFKEDAQDIDESVNLDHITIDYNEIKKKVKHFHGLASKDDEHVSYKETEKLLQALGGSIRIVEEGGHFLEEEGFVSFSELQAKMQKYMTQ